MPRVGMPLTTERTDTEINFNQKYYHNHNNNHILVEPFFFYVGLYTTHKRDVDTRIINNTNQNKG